MTIPGSFCSPQPNQVENYLQFSHSHRFSYSKKLTKTIRLYIFLLWTRENSAVHPQPPKWIIWFTKQNYLDRVSELKWGIAACALHLQEGQTRKKTPKLKLAAGEYVIKKSSTRRAKNHRQYNCQTDILPTKATQNCKFRILIHMSAV